MSQCQRVGDPVDRAFKRTVEKPVVAAAKLYVPVRRWANCHSHHIPTNNWNTIGGPALGLALAPSPGWIAAMEYLQKIGVVESRDHGLFAVAPSHAVVVAFR